MRLFIKRNTKLIKLIIKQYIKQIRLLFKHNTKLIKLLIKQNFEQIGLLLKQSTKQIKIIFKQITKINWLIKQNKQLIEISLKK